MFLYTLLLTFMKSLQKKKKNTSKSNWVANYKYTEYTLKSYSK